MRVEHRNKYAVMNVGSRRRCNSGRGMNEGRKGTLMQGKSRQDVKLAAFLFMSSLEVESSGTDTANLYE